MSDFNNDPLNSATAATSGASEPKASQPFEVKTAAHARHLLKVAQERATKQAAALADTQAQIVEYERLANTLPEGVSSAPSAFADVAVGTVVTFDYGREDRRHERSGKIVARKNSEDGNKVLQYRVQVGDGFEAELVNVFPGQIKSAASAE